MFKKNPHADRRKEHILFLGIEEFQENSLEN